MSVESHKLDSQDVSPSDVSAALLAAPAIHGMRRRNLLGGALAGVAGALLPRTSHALTAVNGTVIGKNNWLFLSYDDPRRMDVSKFRAVASVVSNTAKILKSANIATVIAFAPSKARLYSEYLPDDFQFNSQTEARYKTGLQLLRDAGALVPDLEDPLTQFRKKSPDTHVYFIGDTHWSAIGAEHAAQVVGDEMLKTLGLPPSAKPGSRLTHATTETYTVNDLARNLDPAHRANYKPEQYQRMEAASGASAGLLDTEEFDVAVVGCSYMQPAFNFAPMLSNRLNRPVGLTWRVHDIGPYRAMLTYLQGSDFKHNRPKAIVWNLHEMDMELLPNNQGAWPNNAMSAKDFLTAVQTATGKNGTA